MYYRVITGEKQKARGGYVLREGQLPAACPHGERNRDRKREITSTCRLYDKGLAGMTAAAMVPLETALSGAIGARYVQPANADTSLSSVMEERERERWDGWADNKEASGLRQRRLLPRMTLSRELSSQRVRSPTSLPSTPNRT